MELASKEKFFETLSKLADEVGKSSSTIASMTIITATPGLGLEIFTFGERINGSDVLLRTMKMTRAVEKAIAVKVQLNAKPNISVALPFDIFNPNVKYSVSEYLIAENITSKYREEFTNNISRLNDEEFVHALVEFEKFTECFSAEKRKEPVQFVDELLEGEKKS